MQLTRRGWEAVAVAVAMVAFGVVTAHPTWLVGGLGLVALLVGLQARFAREVVKLGSMLRLTADLESTAAVKSDPCRVRLEVARPPAGRLLPLTVGPPSSPSALVHDRNTVCHLPSGEQRAAGSATLTWQVAGEFDLEPPTISVADAWGLFETDFEGAWAGDEPTIRVRPPEPWDVHVGQGGDLAVPGMGENEEVPIGDSLTPAGLREYQPGDPMRHIDWKATARMQYPHVREFESDSDVATVLVVDHGASMALGPSGRTKLDYGREVALSFVASCQRHGEALGLYAAGDEGLTHAQSAQSSMAAYKRIEDALVELSPTGVDASGDGPWTTDGGSDRSRGRFDLEPSRPGTGPQAGPVAGPEGRPRTHYRALGEILGVTRRLSTDGSAYGRTLEPLLRGINPYEVSADQPLFEAVGATGGRSGQRGVGVALVTDDVNRPAVRRAVREAQRRASYVTVFLLPTVLFEPGDLADLERAYEEYVSFEHFRRELGSFDGVTAFEVGPGDRLDRILASADDATAVRSEVAD